MTEATTTKPLVAVRHRSFTSLREGTETYKLIFKWHGGAYIEVEFADDYGPHDTINVWDYSKGESSIDGWPGFREKIAEYMETMDKGELRKRWINR